MSTQQFSLFQSIREKNSVETYYGKRPIIVFTWVSSFTIYLIAVAAAIIWAVTLASKISAKIPPQTLPVPQRLLLIFGGMLLSLLPTLYWWWASRDFDKWIRITRGPTLNQEVKDREIANFAINREFAGKVWAIVLAVFAAFVFKL